MMRIAFQGEAGAFSEAAALRYDAAAEPMACESFEAVFDAVEKGRARFGVLPVENSIGGTIHRNYDLLVEHELPIVGEVELRVVHNLLASHGTTFEQIRRIYSHPQALAQCDRFLRSLTGIEIVATYDTAGSARMIREHNWTDAGAIASERAAQVFDLSVLKRGIQDFDTNITRFIVISRAGAPARPPDKTTIVFTLPNAPGALFKALSVFALRDIDLTKLESRPMRGQPWQYLFYVDLGVPRDDLRCARALVHLAEFAPSLRTLGSYPRWEEPAEATGPGSDEVKAS
jgi:prephenate dehydratase